MLKRTYIFAVRLHVMQHTVLSRPFCLSVCPSVKRVDCDKTKETCAHILIPRFRTRKMVGGGDPLYLKFWVKLTLLCWSENADSQSTLARSASAVTPSEKNSINTNRKSTASFRMSLRRTSYVVQDFQRKLKNAKRPFSLENCSPLPCMEVLRKCRPKLFLKFKFATCILANWRQPFACIYDTSGAVRDITDRLRNDLKCVDCDVKHCSIQSSPLNTRGFAAAVCSLSKWNREDIQQQRQKRPITLTSFMCLYSVVQYWQT